MSKLMLFAIKIPPSLKLRFHQNHALKNYYFVGNRNRLCTEDMHAFRKFKIGTLTEPFDFRFGVVVRCTSRQNI